MKSGDWIMIVAALVVCAITTWVSKEYVFDMHPKFWYSLMVGSMAGGVTAGFVWIVLEKNFGISPTNNGALVTACLLLSVFFVSGVMIGKSVEPDSRRHVGRLLID